MSLLFPSSGEVIALKALLNNTAGQNLQIKLYQNNHTPSNTDTAASYTECTFGGYTTGGNALSGASWNFTAGNPSNATYSAAQSWTYNGTTPNTIYGYFCTQVTSGTLVYAELDPAPFTLSTSGDIYQVTPVITAT